MPKWVYRPGHPKASEHGFVAVEDLGDWQGTPDAVNAPILSGRFYEGAKSTEGVDIGSRAKHKAYMKEHDLAMFSDYNPDWYERVRKEQHRQEKKDRREVLERAFHDIDNGKNPRRNHG